MLNLGGGWSAHFDDDGRVDLQGVNQAVNDALAHHFPDTDFPDLHVIAEPGRYFAETAACLFTPVIGESDKLAVVVTL